MNDIMRIRGGRTQPIRKYKEKISYSSTTLSATQLIFGLVCLQLSPAHQGTSERMLVSEEGDQTSASSRDDPEVAG